MWLLYRANVGESEPFVDLLLVRGESTMLLHPRIARSRRFQWSDPIDIEFVLRNRGRETRGHVNFHIYSEDEGMMLVTKDNTRLTLDPKHKNTFHGRIDGPIYRDAPVATGGLLAHVPNNNHTYELKYAIQFEGTRGPNNGTFRMRVVDP